MATEEHKYLADIIKRTHATLRKEARNDGPEIAWQRHVTRKEVLQEYAVSMQKLATTCWNENNLDSNRGIRCRVEWVKSQCKEYFLNGGREKYNEREEIIKAKINLPSTDHIDNANHVSNKQIELSQDSGNKISLLDVGSCYNPFGSEHAFDVTAIDLMGIPTQVLQCDFLNVKIGKHKLLTNDKDKILQLPESAFDVVVFSLFLEYLPCPEQRYVCCKKAYDLLQAGGILFIISPDSKHVNANAKLMKSWRLVLSKLGFMRIKYEKLPHIHCMIFRKCIFENVALRWSHLQTLPKDDLLYCSETAIYIPQDFRVTSGENTQEVKEKYSVDELTSMFNELPFECE